MPTRLRLAWIEEKKKRVHFIQGHGRSVRLTPEQEACLKEIRERIQDGRRLPRFCYRVNRDFPDDLLMREGIMHLHLSAKDREEILFLVQYEEHVVFLEVTNHAPFKNDPPGSYLAQLHENALLELESKIDAEKTAEVAATRAKVLEGIKPRQKPGTK
jgi:hypothetical protein